MLAAQMQSRQMEPCAQHRGTNARFASCNPRWCMFEFAFDSLLGGNYLKRNALHLSQAFTLKSRRPTHEHGLFACDFALR